jgi:hypothetical protein
MLPTDEQPPHSRKYRNEDVAEAGVDREEA